MTRSEAIARITNNASQLDDDQLAALAEYTAYLAGPTVYATLPQAEKDKIDAAIAEADRGDMIPWESVRADLEKALRAAKA